jgi:hypothetical protein
LRGKRAERHAHLSLLAADYNAPGAITVGDQILGHGKKQVDFLTFRKTGFQTPGSGLYDGNAAGLADTVVVLTHDLDPTIAFGKIAAHNSLLTGTTIVVSAGASGGPALP